MVLTKSYEEDEALKLRNFLLDKELKVEKIIPVLAMSKSFGKSFKLESYGLDELNEATLEILPNSAKKAYINAQKVSMKLKQKTAHRIVNGFTTTALLEGALPIPFADAPALIAMEATMLASITAVFGVNIDKAMFTAIVSSVLGTTGATIAGKSAVANLLKLIPGAGSIVGGAISGGTALLITKTLGTAYIQLMSAILRGEMKEDELNQEDLIKKLQEFMKK